MTVELQTDDGLEVREVAERLGLTVRQVYHLIVYRELRPRLRPEGGIRVTEEAVEAYLERQRMA